MCVLSLLKWTMTISLTNSESKALFDDRSRARVGTHLSSDAVRAGRLGLHQRADILTWG